MNDLFVCAQCLVFLTSAKYTTRHVGFRCCPCFVFPFTPQKWHKSQKESGFELLGTRGTNLPLFVTIISIAVHKHDNATQNSHLCV